MNTTTGPRLSVRNKVGLVMAGLLGVGELTGPSPAAIAAAFHFPKPTGNGDAFSFDPSGPAVVGVMVAAVVLGLATIVCVVLTWVRGSRVAARVVAAARVISVLLIAPVFLLQGLESWIFLLAAGLVILNITTVILVLSRPPAS